MYQALVNKSDIDTTFNIPNLKIFLICRCHHVATDKGQISHEHLHALVHYQNKKTHQSFKLEIFFLRGCLPLGLSSCDVVFLLTSCEAVFHARPSLQRRTKRIQLRFHATILFWLGLGGRVGGVENCKIRLNSAPLSLSWGLAELGNIYFSIQIECF